MGLVWKYSESTELPSTFEVNNDKIYIRKDIQSVEREQSDGSKLVYYTYQETIANVNEAIVYLNNVVAEQNESFQSSLDYISIMTEVDI